MADWAKSVVIAVAIVAGLVWGVVKTAEYGASERAGWGITVAPGPVTPTPNIEEHVAAVMGQGCPPCPECPTWDALRRAGVEVTCGNAFGEIPPVNYWPTQVYMGCSRIKKLVVTDKRITVERR